MTMQPAITLHNYWRSSASYRVRIALALKGLAYRYEAVHIVRDGGEQKRPEYVSKNPMAQVPTLEIVEGELRRFLPQSLPIIEYIEEIWPTPRLLPEEPYLRARTRALAEVINSGIQPFQNLPLLRRVSALGGPGKDQELAALYIGDGLAAFAEMVTETRGMFCVGDAPTLADCFLIPQLYAARRFGVSYGHLAVLTAIEHNCNALSAFTSAAPELQPDASS
jgi:maleylpyruvate isomerase